MWCLPPVLNPSGRPHEPSSTIVQRLPPRRVAAGNVVIPVVHHLTARVAMTDTDAARYVHWGATSQDILDTGLVLQLRAAVPTILDHLERAQRAAAELAQRYADTAMPGRTWLQQATPITFGLKAAGWADALDRTRRRVATTLDDALVLQFGGASGTLAALGSPRTRCHRRVGDTTWPRGARYPVACAPRPARATWLRAWRGDRDCRQDRTRHFAAGADRDR